MEQGSPTDKIGAAFDEAIEEQEASGQFVYDQENEYGLKPYPMPQGGLGHLVETIMSRARYPHINFAIPCAISLAGALGCNRFMHNGTYSNLYVMVIGASGTGKNDHMDHVGKIARKIHHSEMIKDEFGSDTAIFNSYKDNKLKNVLLIQDEFSGFLAKMNVKNNISTSGMEASINKLFSLAGNFYSGKDNKSVESVEATESPCFSILGGIQPEKLIPFLRAESLGSGLLGRFLPFFGKGTQEQNENVRVDVPQAIIELGYKLMSTCFWQPNAKPIGITDEAANYFRESTRANRAKMFILEEGIERTLKARRDEQVGKLALTAAVMEYNGKIQPITLAHIKWAEATVDMVQSDYKCFVEDYLHTDEHSMMIRRVTKYIKGAGPAGRSKREIQRKFHLKIQTLNGCMDTMIEAGYVINAEYKGITRPRSAWVHESFATEAIDRVERFTNDVPGMKAILYEKY